MILSIVETVWWSWGNMRVLTQLMMKCGDVRWFRIDWNCGLSYKEASHCQMISIRWYFGKKILSHNKMLSHNVQVQILSHNVQVQILSHNVQIQILSHNVQVQILSYNVQVQILSHNVHVQRCGQGNSH